MRKHSVRHRRHERRIEKKRSPVKPVFVEGLFNKGSKKSRSFQLLIDLVPSMSIGDFIKVHTQEECLAMNQKAHTLGGRLSRRRCEDGGYLVMRVA